MMSQSGIVRFYLRSISPEVELYASPVNVDPSAPISPVSYPDDASEKLVEALGGPYYTQGMAEEVSGEWLKALLGLPSHASFALVTGCQMAHVTCLAAARHAVLERHGWDVSSSGLHGTPPINIVTGARRHITVDRALRY